MHPPAEIRALCNAFLDGLKSVLGRKLHGVYLYGATAFPDGGAIGDVDFHVIVAAALDDREKAALVRLHRALAQAYPPLGGELDGYYILLADAQRTSPPQHQWLDGVVDNSWALHCAHIRAGRCIALYGPDPSQIYPAVAWPELEGALEGELAYVAAHLTEAPAYCLLNLCRLMYSFATGDVVVSKAAAARWALSIFPAWSAAIGAALKCYTGTATDEERALLRATISDFFAFASARIAQSWHKNSPTFCS